jgi:hypothetical protein
VEKVKVFSKSNIKKKKLKKCKKKKRKVKRSNKDVINVSKEFNNVKFGEEFIGSSAKVRGGML